MRSGGGRRLFAAWIVALSGNEEIVARARDDINGALLHFRWERLHTCLFFMAECVYWQLHGQQPPSAMRPVESHP